MDRTFDPEFRSTTGRLGAESNAAHFRRQLANNDRSVHTFVNQRDSRLTCKFSEVTSGIGNWSEPGLPIDKMFERALVGSGYPVGGFAAHYQLAPPWALSYDSSNNADPNQ